MRQLDAFDDVQLARERFAVPRVDLFDEAPGRTLLQQLQAQIRDLVPLEEAAKAAESAAPASDDHSIEHPLQPFSRRYFEDRAQAVGHEPALFTYAAEWRSAHESEPAELAERAQAPLAEATRALPPLTIDGLAAFLKNPVQAYFRQRLQVRFDERSAPVPDDESFATAGLDRWQLMDEVLAAARRESQAPCDMQALVQTQVARLQRAGRLPLAGPGRHVQAELQATLQPMVLHWQALQALHPQRHAKQALRWVHPALPGVGFGDRLTGLQSSGEPGAAPLVIDLQASRLADRTGKRPRADKLLKAWVRGLAAAACGQPVAGIVIGADVVLHLAPLLPDEAHETLQALTAAWAEGLAGDAPLPTAVNTGLALLKSAEAAALTFEGSSYGASSQRGEGQETCLARLFPDFRTLAAQPGFAVASARLYTPLRDWLASHVRMEPLPGQAAAEDEADSDD